MNKQLQEECKQLILKYQSYKYESYKVKCRNELYMKMKPWMLKWVRKTCVAWGKTESKEEILSLSWFAFFDCLERHNGSDVHVPKYFYDFTRFYLLNHYAIKDHVQVPLEEFEDILRFAEQPAIESFAILAKLHRLKLAVPEKYRIILDDALLSLHKDPSQRCISTNLPVGLPTYYLLKKIFKSIIVNYIIKSSK